MVIWPAWWDWDLELSPHLLKRMVDRRFTEVELRDMPGHADGYAPDHIPGRFVIECRHAGEAWRVIVEPDDEDELLVVVTAHRIN